MAFAEKRAPVWKGRLMTSPDCYLNILWLG
jgi:hypothetical protein